MCYAKPKPIIQDQGKSRKLAYIFNNIYQKKRKYLPVTKSFNQAKQATLKSKQKGRIKIHKWKGTTEIINKYKYPYKYKKYKKRQPYGRYK